MASPQLGAGNLSLGEEVATLATILDQQRLDTYVNLAATSFYVWDMILTTDDEINYIWGSPTSIVKIFYFLNRYLRLILMVGPTVFVAWPRQSAELCLAIAISGTLGIGVVGTFLTGVIMQIRLYALYNRNTKLIVCVASLFTAQIVSILVLAVLQIAPAVHATQRTATILGVPFCSLPLSSTLSAIPIPILLFDSIVLVLACYKSIQRYRLFPATSRIPQSGKHLVTVLLRDSVWYFLVNFAVYLTNVLSYRFGSPELYTQTASWSIVVVGAAASRMLVNTRKAVRIPQHGSKFPAVEVVQNSREHSVTRRSKN